VPCYFDDPRQAPPGDRERAEDVLDIPLGSVVISAETGKEWVFFGWSSNTAGTYPNFIEALTPARYPGVPFYDYHAAYADTLERKFPDVARFRRTQEKD
jgi:hypothetical protein